MKKKLDKEFDKIVKSTNHPITNFIVEYYLIGFSIALFFGGLIGNLYAISKSFWFFIPFGVLFMVVGVYLFIKTAKTYPKK